MAEKHLTDGTTALAAQPRVIKIEAAEKSQNAQLRVAAYTRVSSDSDDQLNSFAAQNRYYAELISGKAEWRMVDIYADEGITGTSAAKREDFQRMMADCRRGLIDQILVKSISRFARNTKDCLEAVRELKELGVKFKVVNVADLLSLQSAKENDEALTDEEFADIFTADKPVLFAYHSYAHDVRGLIYDRPNHDNFNVHGYEEEGSTTTPYDMVRVNRIDRYELTAEALRMIDADKYADKIDELEKFRDEAFQFAVDNGYDHPDYTDWVYSGVNTDKKGAVTATAATAGDNE